MEESLKSDDDDGEDEMDMLNPTIQRLPADSKSIRKNIIDTQFNCDEREPGFYADIDNDCQVRENSLMQKKKKHFHFN